MAEQMRWGRQTELALANFGHIGGPLPMSLVQALVAIKIEAAAVNAELGVIDSTIAQAIAAAGESVLVGEHSNQFPVDVFQTGSGTSTNMNVNEVLASLATDVVGSPVHPNDHVNASQSSNDTFPTAIRVAALVAVRTQLLPAVDALHRRLVALAEQHAATVKLGRTHLMDAVPMTFGDEVGGWARLVERAGHRIDAAATGLAELPLGGTAVGSGLNAPDAFASGVIGRLSTRYALDFTEAADHFEAQSSQDVLSFVTAACRSLMQALHKIAGDIRLLGSGPTGGLGELGVPDLQAGSSIMPGKVNPVIPEAVQQIAAQVVGNDAAVAFATTASTLQLNTAMPVMALNTLQAIAISAHACALLDRRCISGLSVDAAHMQELVLRSPSLVTALAPEIGYDRSAVIAKRMVAERLSVEQAVRAELGDAEWDRLKSLVDPTRMTGH